ncbi:MAG: hypothetical protein IKU03_07785 [Bacteroidales bacterium]|nr:hypothetical protein [Bacteroidales bacterium]
MSKKKVTAPYHNLQEIDYRRKQLHSQIHRQEKILMKDMDAYEDDIETFKRLWSRVKGVRHFRDNFNGSGVVQAVQSVRSLPLGKKDKKTKRKAGWITAFTLGTEVVNWIIQRRRKKGK